MVVVVMVVSGDSVGGCSGKDRGGAGDSGGIVFYPHRIPSVASR